MTVVTGTVAELARVLGAPRPTLGGAALGSTDRFRAIGVIASASGQGAALISIERSVATRSQAGRQLARCGDRNLAVARSGEDEI